MYEAEHAVDEGELSRLTAKDILTSLPEESTDDKICLGSGPGIHYWSTYSLVFYLEPRSFNFSLLLCKITELSQITWVSFDAIRML